MSKRTPRINPDKEGNSYDFVAMYFMRQHFVEKELAEAARKSPTITYLGKLVIWENILSYKLAFYVRAIQNRINEKISAKRNYIKTDDPIGLLGSDKTLGGLIIKLEELNPQNKHLAFLKKINSDRNTLTHYMHLGFTDIKNITLKARGLTIRMDRAVREISTELRKITPNLRVKIPKTIVLSELAKSEREKASARYPDYLKVKDNLKKFNQGQ